MKRSSQDDYAEAFRRGYDRARRGHEPTVRLEREGLPSADGRSASPSPGAAESVESSRSGSAPAGPRGLPRKHLLAAVGVALLLVVGAFGVGRMLAGSGSGSISGSGGGVAEASVGEAAAAASRQRAAAPYEGAVAAVDPVGSEATCQSAASVDAAGNPVTYEPGRAHDADLSTAWRCDGTGAGQRFTVLLPADTEVAEVGLVPGYAKTDPVSGVDRYAENSRITRVRWHLGDGTTVVQEIAGDPGDRSMRTLRVPVTRTADVVLEILASTPGTRGTVAISEIRVAAPTRG